MDNQQEQIETIENLEAEAVAKPVFIRPRNSYTNLPCKAKLLGTIEIFDKKKMKGMTKAEKRTFLEQAHEVVEKVRAQFSLDQAATIKRKFSN